MRLWVGSGLREGDDSDGLVLGWEGVDERGDDSWGLAVLDLGNNVWLELGLDGGNVRVEGLGVDGGGWEVWDGKGDSVGDGRANEGGDGVDLLVELGGGLVLEGVEVGGDVGGFGGNVGDDLRGLGFGGVGDVGDVGDGAGNLRGERVDLGGDVRELDGELVASVLMVSKCVL